MKLPLCACARVCVFVGVRVTPLLLLFSSSVVSDSSQPHGLQPTRLLCPWDSPGKKPGASCHFLLQRIFPTQGSNPGLLHWQVNSLPLSHQGSPVYDSLHTLILKRNLIFPLDIPGTSKNSSRRFHGGGGQRALKQSEESEHAQSGPSEEALDKGQVG